VEYWHVLAVLGVAFLILEIFVPSFFMAPAGLAFLLTAALSPWLGFTSMIGVLAVTLLAVYAVFYFFVWPRLPAPQGPRTNISAMVGQIAVVIEPVLPDGSSGSVKLYGDTWRAVSDRAFEVGQRVVILELIGNKVVVGSPPLV